MIHEKLTTALLELDKFNSTEIEDIEDLEAISTKATPKEKKKKFSLKNYRKLQQTSCPHKPLELAAARVGALGIRSSVDFDSFHEFDPVGLVSRPLVPSAEDENFPRIATELENKNPRFFCTPRLSQKLYSRDSPRREHGRSR